MIISNVIFLQSDWWLGVDTGLLYLLVDYTLNKIYSDGQANYDPLYYLDWSSTSAFKELDANHPVYGFIFYGVIAFVNHFALS